MVGPDEPPDGDRTVFMPTPGAPGQAPGPTPEEANSAIGWGAPAAPTAPPAPATTAPSAQPTLGGFASSPSIAPGRVEVGAVLNNIFEVTRFIARGGMGEVFEGVNVNTEERVAIKVMLPTLSADPSVRAMFNKEARTLTRLHHPALVQYRVLAQEPQLGVLYMVTEFIDGPALSDVLSTLSPSPQDLRALTRRLAEGLEAAHRLGAVHRDMSPDNVLLPGGVLNQAKIIDFGIAKDLDTSKATIVGDGFAGKLGYVAPEQFGDYGREVGPWTDVYSLGLVILATALGKNVDMGATLVDAIDKRRAGPDLAPIPPDLRPVLEGMLAADPARRFRSMDEVLAALDGSGRAAAAPTVAPAAEPRTVFAPGPKAGAVSAARPASGKKGPPVVLLAAGGAAVLAVVAGAAFLLMGKGGSKPAEPPPATIATSGASVGAARRAVAAALPSIGCAWLDLAGVTAEGGGVAVRLAGVAGSPASVQGAVSRAGSAAGVTLSDVNLDDVAPVEPAVCMVLDAFRGFRADTSVSGQHITSEQTHYEMAKQADGKIEAEPVIELQIPPGASDFALVNMDPDGTMDLTPRANIEAAAKQGVQVKDEGQGRYRLSFHSWPAGWKGLMLLTGNALTGADLLLQPPASRGADWADKIRAAAAAGGWKAEIVWYDVTEPAGGAVAASNAGG